MKHLQLFESYNEPFEVEEVEALSDLNPGDLIFKLGEWLTVKEVTDDSATLVSDSGAHSRLTPKDFERMAFLRKIIN